MPKVSVSASAGSASSSPVMKPLRISCATIQSAFAKNSVARSATEISAAGASKPLAAGHQHHDVVGDAQGRGHVLLDEQHGDAGFAHPRHRLHGLADEFRRQPGRRFVEQQHFRIGQQRAGKGQHLALAAGQIAGQQLRPLGEFGKQRHHLRGLRRADAGAAAQEFGGELQIFADRQAGKDVGFLRHVGEAGGDPLGGRQIGDVASGDRQRAAARPQQAGQCLDEGGLAGAVRADHRQNAFRRLVEVDAADDVAAGAIAGAQAADRERGSDGAHTANPR